MNFNTKHILFICFLLSVFSLTYVAAVTDAELEALGKQIEQLEVEVKRKADAKQKAEKKRNAETEAIKKRLVESEKKRLEEEKKSEAARLVELERKRLEEEMKRKAEEKKLKKEEKYSEHIKLAEAYMIEDKFDMAIREYQTILDSSPDDNQASEGINQAQKYLIACDDIVGTWYIEPNGITWKIFDGNTVFGTLLIFSADGQWECVNAREREVFISWPECGVCVDEYFLLSEDNNTLKPSRNTGSLGKRIIDSKNDRTQKNKPKISL